MLNQRQVPEFLLVVFTAVFLFLFLTTADARLYFEGVWPLRPVFMVMIFSALYLSLALIKIARRADLDLLYGVFKNNAKPLVPLAILSLVTAVWSLLPTAYSSPLLVLYPAYSLSTVLISMLILLLRSFRTNWRYYLLPPIIGLGLGIFQEAMDPLDPGLSRPGGISGDPNFAAFFIAILCASALRYGRILVIDIAVIAFTGLSIFVTLSRSGTVAFSLVVVLYIVQATRNADLSKLRQIHPRSVGVGMLGIIVLGLATFFSGAYLLSNSDLGRPKSSTRLEMFSGERGFASGSSADSRLALALDAIELIQQAPIIGHGTGFTQYSVMRPHNTYLEIWVNLGIIGVACYVWALVVGYRTFSQRAFVPGQAFILVVALNGMFSHQQLQQRPIWVLYGILLSISWFRGRLVRAVRTRRRARGIGGERVSVATKHSASGSGRKSAVGRRSTGTTAS